MRNTKEMRGARVLGGKYGTRKIGKVQRAIFNPDDFSLVGYLISRPDLLLMFKRDDVFLAYDAFRVVDGRIVAAIDRDAWDEPACKRLGLDWESCLILEGMPIKTSEGDDIGRVDSVTYDERTGTTESLEMTDGMTAKALLGVSVVPIEYVIGYQDGYLIVQPKAMKMNPEGGLAAKAGEGVALASKNVSDMGAKAADVVGAAVVKAGKAAGSRVGQLSRTTGEKAEKAGAAAGKAVDKGAVALGKQLRKSKGMFSAFKEEYNKEAKRDTNKDTKITKKKT
ncbi:MAG: PRC-barrel domain protein [Coriobacteriaceae bacterium]|nr:PRC-barrel domain protein [Coriobacteriaceae bacterium]